MPQIVQLVREQPHMPSDIVRRFEQDIALGLLSCRVVDQTDHGSLSKIILPSLGEATELAIPTERLGRKL
jgi:hypothetical protein